MLDGLGQGTSLVRGIWYDPDRYGEVGAAAWEAMTAFSFKQRFMYMTGVKDEAASDAVMAKMDVTQLSPKLSIPCFVMAGEEHGMGGSRPSQLGPPFFPVIASRLVDRARGKPLQPTHAVVDTTGQTHSEPRGERRIDMHCRR